MSTRVLPGVYMSLNDMSQFPEGGTALTIGYVVKANRGPVNEATLVTSPSDFLTKFTFSGSPAVGDDPTFHSILKILPYTNSMYVVRAANDPLYGGIVFKSPVVLGNVKSTTSNKITVAGTSDIAKKDVICVNTTGKLGGYYTVSSVAKSTGDSVITVEETVAVEVTYAYAISEATVSNTFKVSGDLSTLKKGNKVTVMDSTVEANNREYTVVSAVYASPNTTITVKEAVSAATDGTLYTKVISASKVPATALTTSIENPENYEFADDDLFLITGIDAGSYNGKLAFEITSSLDNPDEMVYHKGADLGQTDSDGNKKLCDFDTVQLVVKNAETGAELESFLFSRDENAKTIDGVSLYIENVLDDSAYIKVVNNDATETLTDLPLSTSKAIQAGGGSDGDEVTSDTLVAAAQVFEDKTIPVSIIGNGCSAEAETNVFHQELLNITDIRKDCVAILGSRYTDETATLSSTRAQNVVDYKKGTDDDGLGSSSFYAAMYAPHVKVTDTYNSRQVRIGADAVAIAGWLSVLSNLGYPYAYAGPKNGLVSGVTTQWKIGDESAEATLLNDASVNYIAYDGKVGRYYMQCQNTLQVANSSMRNLGCVLNILEIKETLATYMKEFINLPITDTLRQEILDACNDYLAPMVGTRFYRYAFQDVTTSADIAQDTLRYLFYVDLTRYAQRIYCTINIVNSTFDFSILQSL